MRSLLPILIVFSCTLSVYSWARPIGNPVIKGIVHAYDKDFVVLRNGERKGKIPRKLLPPGTKLKSGEYLEFEMSDKELLSLVNGMKTTPSK